VLLNAEPLIYSKKNAAPAKVVEGKE